MKIGQRCIDPRTKAKGRVVNVMGRQLVCRAEDGSYFRMPAESRAREQLVRRKRFVPRPCEIRIKGVDGILRGMTTGKTPKGRYTAVVTDGNLIWHDCPVKDGGEVEIVVMGRGRPAKGQRDEVLAVGARRK